MAAFGIEPVVDGIGYTIPTEVAATAFGLLAGVAGGVAQLVAGRSLSEVTSDRIRLRSLAIPIGVGALGTVAGAFLVPGGE